MSYVMAEPDFNPADDPDPFYEDRISAAVNSQDLTEPNTANQIADVIADDEAGLQPALAAFVRGNSDALNNLIRLAQFELAERGDDCVQLTEQEYCNG